MYSRFIFGNFKGQDIKNKELHKYGAFVDPFPSKNGEASEMAWMTKLRINQARLISKQEDNLSNIDALIPRSFCTLPPPSFLSKQILAPLVPSSLLFELNFSPVDPSTGETLSEYSFPYFSSYFQANSQLLRLETRIDPFSYARKYNFSDYFCIPQELLLDYYSPDNIKHLLHFIPGEIFSSQLLDNHHIHHMNFFLFHIVCANVLVPILNTMVLTLLQRGLPGDTSLWGPLITDMKDFSHLLHRYFSNKVFYLQGPYPSSPDPDDASPIFHLCFRYPTDDCYDQPCRNYLVPDHFYHPDPV